MDNADFRKALGCFATGITVVTSMTPDGRPLGLTVNSFNSVSLDPPLVLFSLDKRNTDLAAFETAGLFAVNVLTRHQQEVSVRFSTRPEQRWTDLDWETLETGAPILERCLANFDCLTEAVHDGGDHVIFLGRVVAMRAHAPDDDADLGPLMYYRGRYVTPDSAV